MAVALLSLALSTEANAAETFVLFEPAAGTWQLSNPTISLAESEHSCVKIAAASLKADFGKVTGTEATITSLTSQLSPLTSKSILIGTVGVNKQIDLWVKQGVLRDLKGKTEKYIIKTIGNQLVIAGSDKRGTVYGIYELSRQIGVSPWYYWADVPVARQTYLYIIYKGRRIHRRRACRQIPWSVSQRRGALSHHMGEEHLRHRLRWS